MRKRKLQGKRRQAVGIEEVTIEAGDPLLVIFTAMKKDVFKGVKKLVDMEENILDEMKKKC